MIQIKNLHKYYNRGKKNELHVLDGINLEFERTGLVCILGESGSGKTTLLNTIGGLDVFASGSLTYEGRTVKRYHQALAEKIRNDNFGYIFQNYYLLQDYTVEYNVKLALNTFDLPEAEKEERVTYVLECLKIGKYKKKLVSQLSGGQKQRVSIARALVKSPGIILADEPTGNLDEENTLRTMSILKNISKECLVILVSHERRIANFFADRIIEIQDGKIKKDYKNQGNSSYERMDDDNIYLKDLKKKEITDGNILVQIFEEEENQAPIRLNFAWKHGKLYIQNLENYDILPAGEEAGCEMLDEHKPSIEMEQVDAFEFTLPRLKAKKEANLSLKEIWKLAIENIRLMGKKQAFIIVILLITGCFMTITLANFTNTLLYNNRSVLKEDSHIVRISMEPAFQMKEVGFRKAARKFYEENFKSGKYTSVFKTNGSSLSLNYDGFAQLVSYDVEFKDFSYVSLSHVKEEDLVYGRMPENMNEIVVDRWLFDRFLDGESPFGSLFSSPGDFLNQKLKSKAVSVDFTIAGICDKAQPSIYMDANKAITMTQNSLNMADTDQMKELDPEITLEDPEDDEVYLSEKEYRNYQKYNKGSITFEGGRTYQIKGSIPDDYGVSYVLNASQCELLREDYMISSGGFDVYVEDAQKAVRELRKISEAYQKDLDILVMNPGSADLQKYEKSKEKQISSSYFIAVAGVLVSLFMIYFMIRSNVDSRAEELTVYRLLGIAKRSIMKAYLLEMFLVTSYTILPVVLITSGVIRFIGQIPSLELGLIFPWWCILLLIVVFYLLNLLISILPVKRILSKPPAVLAAER